MLNNYEKQLRQTNLADNTIVSYCHSLKQYLEMYENVFTKKNLLSYKGFLIENYSPKTVNLRILAINKYLEFNKLDKLKLKWLDSNNLESGYLFLNRFGEKITTRGVAHQLKIFAAEYGMDTKVVYPHSFRHRFAKNFLEKYNDLAFLADLMGHESIETTRIYLRKTANEQQEIVQ